MAEVTPEMVERLMLASAALVKAVSRDDTGELIGNTWLNSNGGLLSPDTIQKADAVRRALEAMK